MHSELDSDAERRDRDWLLRDYSGVVSELAKVTAQRDEALKALTELAIERDLLVCRVQDAQNHAKGWRCAEETAIMQRDEAIAERDKARAEAAKCRAERDKALDLLSKAMDRVVSNGAQWADFQRLSNRALQITRTQARIGAWGDSCPAVQAKNEHVKIGLLGHLHKHAPVFAALEKLAEEVDELIREIVDREAFDRELADVAIVVFRIAHLRGFPLLDAIEAKMLEVVAKHGGLWMDRDGKEHGNG